MYSKDDVELALLAVEEGMSTREAAELVGCGPTAVRDWLAGRLPRSCRPSPRIQGEGTRRGGRMCPRGTYNPPAAGPLAGLEPAQIENMLLRAVLADLKAGGWEPGSISSRSKCELGERLRLASGLPLRSTTGFLRISRSSYEYRRARLGRDGHAGLREGGPPPDARGGPGGSLAPPQTTGPRAVGPDARPANVPRERAAARRARGEDFPADPDFSAPAPGEPLVTDVTELAWGDRKCYLSAVVDCYDGMPVSWSLSPRPDSALCDSSLRSALDSLPPGSAPVVHTDGGGPYRSAGWKALCSARGARCRARGAAATTPRPRGSSARSRPSSAGPRAGRGPAQPGSPRRSPTTDYMGWYRDGRLERFEEPGGGHRYETIAGRRLGVPL